MALQNLIFKSDPTQWVLKAPLQIWTYIPKAAAPLPVGSHVEQQRQGAEGAEGADAIPHTFRELTEAAGPHSLCLHWAPAPAPITASSPTKESQGHGGSLGRNCTGRVSHPPQVTSPVTLGPMTSTANSKGSFFESKCSFKG